MGVVDEGAFMAAPAGVPFDERTLVDTDGDGNSLFHVKLKALTEYNLEIAFFMAESQSCLVGQGLFYHR